MAGTPSRSLEFPTTDRKLPTTLCSAGNSREVRGQVPVAGLTVPGARSIEFENELVRAYQAPEESRADAPRFKGIISECFEVRGARSCGRE